MGLFKKIRRFVHPGSRLFDQRGNTQGYVDIGQMNANQAALDAAMKDYGNIETDIRDQYTNAAKKAGTYADTNEFKSGLNSEVQSGVRGARVDAVKRINALRKAMGNNEEFKPEGYDTTQANQTADKLAAAPDKEESPQSAVSDEPAVASTSNAASGVQNMAPKQSFNPLAGAGMSGLQKGRLLALRRMV